MTVEEHHLLLVLHTHPHVLHNKCLYVLECVQLRLVLSRCYVPSGLTASGDTAPEVRQCLGQCLLLQSYGCHIGLQGGCAKYIRESTSSHGLTVYDGDQVKTRVRAVQYLFTHVVHPHVRYRLRFMCLFQSNYILYRE